MTSGSPLGILGLDADSLYLGPAVVLCILIIRPTSM